MSEPRNLKITGTDSSDGLVILNLADSDGAAYEVKLNSMDVASLMGGVSAQLDTALQTGGNWGMPGVQRVQFVETPEKIFFRVFLSEHQYHEYPVPKDTTLATELKSFADRVEARNAAKATHQPPSAGNKH